MNLGKYHVDRKANLANANRRLFALRIATRDEGGVKADQAWQYILDRNRKGT